MKDNRLQVTHRLGLAIQRGELLLLENRSQRLRGRRPDTLLLLEAQIIERGADRHNKVARERIVRLRDRERRTLRESSAVGLGSLDGRGHLLGGRGGRGFLGTNGHLARGVSSRSAICFGRGALSNTFEKMSSELTSNI
tara:strand:- start:13441 stop:13857 length:417 start_codon:yes stop_codon:yes gene_type:complete